MNDAAKGKVLLERAPDGGSTFRVKLQDETVWLTQKQMAALFQTERSFLTKHIRNIPKTQDCRPIQYVQILYILPRTGKCIRQTTTVSTWSSPSAIESIQDGAHSFGSGLQRV